MSEHDVTITRARLLRHAPATRQGAEAAAVDIAQDPCCGTFTTLLVESVAGLALGPFRYRSGSTRSG